MYKYAEVESAIAGLHGVQGDSLKTFRSRIKHFQRIGLVPSAPGKGQKISYKMDNVVQWAICFELAELNLPPMTIKNIIFLDGYQIRMRFMAYPLEEQDWYYFIAGHFLTWDFDTTGKLVSGMYNSSVLSVSDLIDQSKKNRVIGPDVSRLVLINLTALKRKLGEALGYEWKDDPAAWDRGMPWGKKPEDAP